jgi:NodT family efflux transporter outer membrane factor (OMF) lipoprotein
LTIAYGIFLAQPLGGCLLADKSDLTVDVPQFYRAGPRNPAVAEAALPSLDWWRAFGSRELTTLIDEARQANFDIAAAIARIKQADAQARIAGAPLLPSVTLNSDASRLRASQTTAAANNTTGTSFGRSERTLFLASLSPSYEIDFWEKNLSAYRAAQDTAAASRYDKEVVSLTTVVSVANAYFQVLAAQDRLQVARQNLAAASRVLNLIQQRASAGTASALDVAQQQSLVDTQRASIPPLTQTLQQNQMTIALLVAKPPERVVVRGGSLRHIAVPRVTPGLPSELITQRPDIREAEANLAAADANVQNARAQMLPSITLTGEGGYQSMLLKTLLRPESIFYTATAGLTQPIFDGFRLRGNFELQKGKQEELLQNYRKSVISGFTDVDKALVAVRQTSLTVKLQSDAVTSSQRAFDISEQRLREGTVDLVTVLQTQQTLFQAQDTLAQDRLARLLAIVSLYQALGGGWPSTPVETANAR